MKIGWFSTISAFVLGFNVALHVANAQDMPGNLSTPAMGADWGGSGSFLHADPASGRVSGSIPVAGGIVLSNGGQLLLGINYQHPYHVINHQLMDTVGDWDPDNQVLTFSHADQAENYQALDRSLLELATGFRWNTPVLSVECESLSFAHKEVEGEQVDWTYCSYYLDIQGQRYQFYHADQNDHELGLHCDLQAIDYNDCLPKASHYPVAIIPHQGGSEVELEYFAEMLQAMADDGDIVYERQLSESATYYTRDGSRLALDVSYDEDEESYAWRLKFPDGRYVDFDLFDENWVIGLLDFTTGQRRIQRYSEWASDWADKSVMVGMSRSIVGEHSGLRQLFVPTQYGSILHEQKTELSWYKQYYQYDGNKTAYVPRLEKMADVKYPEKAITLTYSDKGAPSSFDNYQIDVMFPGINGAPQTTALHIVGGQLDQIITSQRNEQGIAGVIDFEYDEGLIHKVSELHAEGSINDSWTEFVYVAETDGVGDIEGTRLESELTWYCDTCGEEVTNPDDDPQSRTGKAMSKTIERLRPVEYVKQILSGKSTQTRYAFNYPKTDRESSDSDPVVLLTPYHTSTMVNAMGDSTVVWIAEHWPELPDDMPLNAMANYQRKYSSNQGRVLQQEHYDGRTGDGTLLYQEKVRWLYDFDIDALRLSEKVFTDYHDDGRTLRTAYDYDAQPASVLDRSDIDDNWTILSSTQRFYELDGDNQTLLHETQSWWGDMPDDEHDNYLSRLLLQKDISEMQSNGEVVHYPAVQYFYGGQTGRQLLSKMVGYEGDDDGRSTTVYEYYDGTQSLELGNEIEIGDLYRVSPSWENEERSHVYPRTRFNYRKGLVDAVWQEQVVNERVTEALQTTNIHWDEMTGVLLASDGFSPSDDLPGTNVTVRYDDQGRVIQKQYVDRAGHLVAVKNWDYEDFGKIVYQWMDYSESPLFLSTEPVFDNSDMSGSNYDGWVKVIRNDMGKVIEVQSLGPKLPDASGDSIDDYQVLVKRFYYDDLHRLERTEISNLVGEMTLESHQVYDALGRITERYAPGNQWVKWSYPNFHVKEKTIEVSGVERMTRYEYDAQGRLYQLFEPRNEDGVSELTQYEYNDFGRLEKVMSKNALGVTGVEQKREFIYDVSGRVIADYIPERGWNEYEYGPHGISFKTDAKSRRYESKYDDWGNLSTVHLHLADDEVLLLSQSYDAYFQLSGILYRNITLEDCEKTTGCFALDEPTRQVSEEYDYDALGRLTNLQMDVFLGRTLSSVRSFQTAYRYDNAGRVTSMQYGLANHEGAPPMNTYGVKHHYDHSGALMQSEQSTDFRLDSDFPADNVVNYHYDHPLGLLTTVDQSLERTARYQLIQSIGYDHAARLQSFTGDFYAGNALLANKASGEYRYYDGVGLIQSIGVDLDNNQVSREFGYDHLGRLNQVDYQMKINDMIQTTHQEVFDYDRYGNRTYHQITTYDEETRVEDRLYDVDSANNQLIAYYENGDWESLIYDDVGSVVRSEGVNNPLGSSRLDRDGLNRLSRMIDESTGDEYVYAYNSQGLRVAQSKRVGLDEITEYYLYSSNGLGAKLVMTYQEQGKTTQQQGRNLEPKTAIFYNALGVGWKHGIDTGRDQLMVNNHLSSPQWLFDTGTEQIESQEYLAYGEPLPNTSYFDQQKALFLEPSAQELLTTTGGFGSHLHEGAMGNQYMQARYFNNGLGRFLRKDPIEPINWLSPQSFNQFSYCNGDPVNCRDATGLTGDHDTNTNMTSYYGSGSMSSGSSNTVGADDVAAIVLWFAGWAFNQNGNASGDTFADSHDATMPIAQIDGHVPGSSGNSDGNGARLGQVMLNGHPIGNNDNIIFQIPLHQGQFLPIGVLDLSTGDQMANAFLLNKIISDSPPFGGYGYLESLSGINFSESAGINFNNPRFSENVVLNNHILTVSNTETADGTSKLHFIYTPETVSGLNAELYKNSYELLFAMRINADGVDHLLSTKKLISLARESGKTIILYEASAQGNTITTMETHAIAPDGTVMPMGLYLREGINIYGLEYE